MIQSIYAKFISELRQQPLLFVSLWVTQFAVLALVLMSVGLAPAMLLAEDIDEEVDVNVVASAVEEIEEAEVEPPTLVDAEYADAALVESASTNAQPVRVMIDAVGIDTKILNPTNTDIASLDAALLEGGVRYPGSGKLTDVSNMFLFGHSSHLPIVNNQNFKAFNNLENLNKGDLIRVQSATEEYHYRVENVDQVKAEDAWVEFDTGKKQLTLSTCNNFGSKQDRFVVVADFIGSFMLDA